jgi:hypothetical protein
MSVDCQYYQKIAPNIATISIYEIEDIMTEGGKTS